MHQANVKDVVRIVLEDRPDAFLELVARELNISPEQINQVRLRLEEMHDSLRRALVDRLTEILKDRHLDMVILTHPNVDRLLTAEVKQHFLKDLLREEPTSAAPVALTPELRAWALRQNTEAEVVAGLQEARMESGPELREAIRRFEQELTEGE